MPFTATDAEIEQALAEAHVPSLITSLIHLTGDLDLIRGDMRPSGQLFGDPQAGISEQDQARMRTLALEALKQYRDGADSNRADLYKPSPEIVREMVHFFIGRELPDNYTDFLMAELRLFGEDPYEVSGIGEVEPGDFHVAVVGAGMSGLLAAIRLKEAGVRFTVFDKNADVGGTWYQNRYPGCRVDSPNHSYSYSFAPNDWPQYFSPQSALLDYFDRIATEYELRDNIKFETEVIEARYEDEGSWTITSQGPNGRETTRVNAIITAVGQLNRPKLPSVEGVGSFEGPAFHTGEWDESVDLKGKRVIVIGTGASAFQTVPEVAQIAERVTIFQRTPPWVFPRPEYHDDIPEGKHWLLNNVPFYAEWFRFWTFWTTAEGLLESVRREEGWNGGAESVGPANQQLREILTANVEAMVGEDPELFAKCVPGYPPAGKRMLVDNGHWFRALKRDNVDLVTDPIRRITASGVETESGEVIEADVIIYGTGFHASKILFPMKLYGRDGKELREHWGADPRAYLGIVVPGYPNLFCCYGPNTNIVVNGSIIFFSECEVRYIMGCLKMLLERHAHSMECRRDVHDAYNEKIDAGNLDMAWGSPHVSSWYKNENGRVTQNWPFSLIDFWNQTREPNPEDYVIR